MSVAETAELLVRLNLGTTGSFAGATKEIQAVEASAVSAGGSVGGVLQSGFGKAQAAAGKFGGALTHAQHQIGGLLSGPLGVLGLSAGLFTFAGVVEKSLEKTSEFGLTIERLTGLTGESAQSMGELTLVTERYGVTSDKLAQIVGFTEKTLGNLQNTFAAVGKAGKSAALSHLELQKAEIVAAGGTTKHIDALIKEQKASDQVAAAHAKTAVGLNKLQALQKEYGVVLTDSKGKALDFSTVLNHVADYYNSNASAANKAALTAKIFGRGYAALIPVLQLGSAGILKAKQAIDDMGLSLGTDSQGALTAYKNALRNLSEAVTVLQIEVGLALAPAITDLANNISLFLEHGGAKQITNFFKDAANFARALGGVIEHQVIPVFSAIGSAWNAIPKEVRDLVVAGFIGNKIIKWTFGFSPITFATDALKSAITSAFGIGISKGFISAGLGQAFIQKVWVVNMGSGLGGGPPGGPVTTAAEDAAGAGGILGSGIGLASLIAGAVIAATPLIAAGIVYATQGDPSKFKGRPAPRANALPPGTDIRNYGSATAHPVPVTLVGDTHGEGAGSALSKVLTGPQAQTLLGPLPGILNSILHANQLLAAVIHSDFKNLEHARTDPEIKAAIKALVPQITNRGGASTGARLISDLKGALTRTHDPALQAEIKRDLSALEKKQPGREWIQKQLDKADKILRSNESSKTKLDQLTAIQRAFTAHGDTHVAAAIEKKKLSVSVKTDVATKVVVNARTVAATNRTYGTYFATTGSLASSGASSQK